MPSQKQVNKYLDVGVPGAKANLNPFVYTPSTPLAEGEVRAGGFVWAGTKTEVFTVKNSGSDAPLGFVERNIVYMNYDPLDAGTLIINEGDAVTVAVKGDYYALSETSADVGQKVYANLDDGGIAVDDAGATLAGYAETSWVVASAGAAGEIIIISNWS